MNSIETVFTDIYKNKTWVSHNSLESGPGSLQENAGDYIEFLNLVLSNFKICYKPIKSILDIGAGDGNLLQYYNCIIDPSIDYTGVDVVFDTIEKNREKYRDYSNINFLYANAITYEFSACYDLVIIKDVLQHLSNESIHRLLANLNNVGRYFLIVNDIPLTQPASPVDIVNGSHRPIVLSNFIDITDRTQYIQFQYPSLPFNKLISFFLN